MIHTVTKVTRVLLARLGDCEPLPEALLEVARQERIDAGTVQGSGVVNGVAVAPFDEGLGRHGAPREIEGTLDLASLSGMIAERAGGIDVRLEAVLARDGAVVAAGLLVRARAVAVEIAVDVYDEGDVERVEGGDGIPAWRPPRRR